MQEKNALNKKQQLTFSINPYNSTKSHTSALNAIHNETTPLPPY